MKKCILALLLIINLIIFSILLIDYCTPHVRNLMRNDVYRNQLRLIQ